MSDDDQRVFKRAAAAWPSYLSDSMPASWKAWKALGEEERAEAVDRAADFVAACKAAKLKVCTFGVYLSEKRWTKLPPKVVKTAETVVDNGVRPFGPAWGYLVFETLLFGEVDPGEPSVSRESRSASYRSAVALLGVDRAQASYRKMGMDFDEDGGLIFPADFEARAWREHRRQKAWPGLAPFYEQAALGHSLPMPKGFAPPQRNMLEAVPINTPMFKAWEDEFDQRGWPWIPNPGRQPVVYFPVGGPDGLQGFADAVMAGQTAAPAGEVAP